MQSTFNSKPTFFSLIQSLSSLQKHFSSLGAPGEKRSLMRGKKDLSSLKLPGSS